MMGGGGGGGAGKKKKTSISVLPQKVKLNILNSYAWILSIIS